MSGRILLLVLALVVLTAYQSINSQTAGSFNGFDLVDQMGNIRKPADVRDLYQLLGTYTVFEPTSMVALGSKSESDEMHITYASPGTAEYYRKNGKFADGTVLVKEVLGTDQARLTTGNAHWAKGVKQWFVMIKDEKNRYPKNPLWGDGWGWALFKSDAPEKQVATDYKKDCLGCHVPASSTDWVYVDGYPVLSAK
jgi:hypothetical protein